MMTETEKRRALVTLGKLRADREAAARHIHTIISALRAEEDDGHCTATWQEIADVLRVKPQSVQEWWVRGVFQ